MRPAEREWIESWGLALGEALTFGLGLVSGLGLLWQMADNSDGIVDPAVAIGSVILVAIGVGVAWRWRLYGVAAGIALSLLGWWFLVAMVGQDSISPRFSQARAPTGVLGAATPAIADVR